MVFQIDSLLIIEYTWESTDTRDYTLMYDAGWYTYNLVNSDKIYKLLGTYFYLDRLVCIFIGKTKPN